jgi:hypothetical protein
MTEPEPELESFIRRLTVATSRGTLAWTEMGKAGFAVTTAGGSFTVQSSESSGEHPYLCQVRNQAGSVISTAETVFGEAYEPWEQEIEELYRVVRNQVLGIDDTFKTLATELELPDVDDDTPF